jgi:xanthine dehydrogenase YagS FAD-binding subunit
MDWPLVEVSAAFALSGDRIDAARVFLGAVAMVPWRAEAVEQGLLGKKPSAELWKEAAQAAAKGATPLTMNGYKVPILIAEVARVLSRAGGLA